MYKLNLKLFESDLELLPSDSKYIIVIKTGCNVNMALNHSETNCDVSSLRCNYVNLIISQF